jgi:2-oxoglutarate ferredoxin oxidoreductase subunit alpha
MLEKPEERTGMVVLQAESELGAINMVYGAAGAGRRVITSSSSPGISLFQEGLSYIAGAELPCVLVNIVRGGPGLGTIQPSQADYFQATKGGGHGDYHLLVLAPASVQEMSDFVKLGFELAFRYRNPVMLLADGLVGQMMEKVELFEQVPRATEFDQAWVSTGKTEDRERNIITSLNLASEDQEKHNLKLQEKYRKMRSEVRYEEFMCKDAEYLIVAYGSSARICQKAIQLARDKGIKAGLLRPVTLFPYPSDRISEKAENVKGMLSVEMNSGQMVEDVRLAVNGRVRVEHFGRFGGMVHSPKEVLEALEQKIINV